MGETRISLHEETLDESIVFEASVAHFPNERRYAHQRPPELIQQCHAPASKPPTKQASNGKYFN